MTSANGRGGKTCEYCLHWVNPRGMPDNPGAGKIGDCTAVLHPAIQGVIPGKGIAQWPGGVYVISLAESFCGAYWRPKLVGLPLAGNRMGVAPESSPLPDKEPA